MTPGALIAERYRIVSLLGLIGFGLYACLGGRGLSRGRLISRCGLG